jgi:L-ascorbate metabolism protein UlaG (beta-lactamase superfamily)
MKKLFIVLGLAQFLFLQTAFAGYLKDHIPTDGGELTITFLGHATLMLEYQGKIIHVDPAVKKVDYGMLPKADLILITHEHGDHYDVSAIEQLKKQDTQIIVNQAVKDKGSDGQVMANGDSIEILDLPIKAVPAYNIVHKRENGELYHPKGRDNGYIITFANHQLYIAGDTENTPEVKALKGIDIAFLPMNLPYTMSPEMVADAVRSFKPTVLYPYHYRGTDPNTLIALLKDQQHTEIRLRKMYGVGE